ncbi:hypothetical protein EDD39_6164 [Kitasatospora cineracea]|uniref:Uncharacterized protein n=1 Tax=Kitasatospora cineracea TaxID=88074 RepID=A0A8G1UC21_9ACTN|nr:hypothetical protein EDD39_6164 [Kitasatospora cineracea]
MHKANPGLFFDLADSASVYCYHCYHCDREMTELWRAVGGLTPRAGQDGDHFAAAPPPPPPPPPPPARPGIPED